MKKYRLAIKYPSLQKEFEEGDMVYYNGLSNVYVRARSPHYSIDVNEVENNRLFWDLIEEEELLTYPLAQIKQKVENYKLAQNRLYFIHIVRRMCFKII